MHVQLGQNTRWQPEAETRDGILAGEKIYAAVMPAALSEWRADPRGGTLESRGGRLILTQETHGRAICCPLVIDLDRRRTKDERTWRQLTVGENLYIVPGAVAVRFCAQSAT